MGSMLHGPQHSIAELACPMIPNARRLGKSLRSSHTSPMWTTFDVDYPRNDTPNRSKSCCAWQQGAKEADEKNERSLVRVSCVTAHYWRGAVGCRGRERTRGGRRSGFVVTMPALQQDASTRRGESFVPRRPPSFRDFVFLVALGTLLGSEAFMPLALNQRGSLGFCRPRATGVLSPARMSAINKRPLDPQVATSWCQINLVLTMHRKIRTWLARKAKASSAMHGESGGGGGCENNSEQGHGGRLGSVAARWNDSAVATRSALLVGPDARERKREVCNPPTPLGFATYIYTIYIPTGGGHVLGGTGEGREPHARAHVGRDVGLDRGVNWRIRSSNLQSLGSCRYGYSLTPRYCSPTPMSHRCERTISTGLAKSSW